MKSIISVKNMVKTFDFLGTFAIILSLLHVVALTMVLLINSHHFLAEIKDISLWIKVFGFLFIAVIMKVSKNILSKRM